MAAYRQIMHCADVASLCLLLLYLFLTLTCPFFNAAAPICDSTLGLIQPRSDVAQSLSSVPMAWFLSGEDGGFIARWAPISYSCFGQRKQKCYWLCCILLLLAGDIQLNPGPLKLGLNFAQFNSQSVNGNSEFDKPLLIKQLILEKELDILALSETWLSPDSIPALVNSCIPDGFCMVHEPRSSGRGGGVAFIINSKIQFSDVKMVHGKSFESIAIKASVSGKAYTFVNVYWPKSSPFPTFLNDFSSLLEQLISLPSSLYISGDFNIHVDDSNDCAANQFKSMLAAFGLSQDVDFPTHKAGHSLDLFIRRSDDEAVSDVVPTAMPFSDHLVIICKIAIPANPSRPPVLTKRIRNFKNFSVADFCTDVLNSGLNYIATFNIDLELHINCFNATLSKILDKHAPLKNIKITDRNNLPFYTSEIRTEKKFRSNLESIWRRNKSKENFDRYKTQAKKVAKLLKYEKKRYYRNLINSHHNKPNKLWTTLNRLCYRTKSTLLPSSVADSDLANKFSCFFSEKVANLCAIFNPTVMTTQLAESPLNAPNRLLNSFEPASESEVFKAIMESSNATCSLDVMPTDKLKACLPALITPITAIVNRCLSEGIFPATFKMAVVKPLLKKHNLPKDDLNNYRPVSNLTFLSKVVERIVYSRLSDHLAKISGLPKFQSAYRPFCSTETALVRIQNDLLFNIDHGKLSALVLLDLSAAFDTIDHTILVKRLRDLFGINNTVLKFMTSYLSDRTQAVVVGNAKSEHKALTSGVPQGSVLGPLLFTLYTVPLSNILHDMQAHHHFYADDTQIYFSFNAPEHDAAMVQLSNILNVVYNWFVQNKLSINPSKTEFLVIGTKYQQAKIPNNISVTINNSNINSSKQVKNLGVIYDTELTFKSHINKICQISFMYIRLLRSIRHYLDLNSTKLLANALLISRIDYCNALLYGVPQSTLHKLQLVQNSIARVVIPGVKRSDHITPVLKQLHWLPIKQRIDFKIALLTYKALHDHSPSYIQELISRVPNSGRRSTSKGFLTIPLMSSSNGQRCFSFAAPKLWNSLPQAARNATSESQFRKLLKSHLFPP